MAHKVEHANSHQGSKAGCTGKVDTSCLVSYIRQVCKIKIRNENLELWDDRFIWSNFEICFKCHLCIFIVCYIRNIQPLQCSNRPQMFSDNLLWLHYWINTKIPFMPNRLKFNHKGHISALYLKCSKIWSRCDLWLNLIIA